MIWESDHEHSEMNKEEFKSSHFGETDIEMLHEAFKELEEIE